MKSNKIKTIKPYFEETLTKINLNLEKLEIMEQKSEKVLETIKKLQERKEVYEKILIIFDAFDTIIPYIEQDLNATARQGINHETTSGQVKKQQIYHKFLKDIKY